MKVQGRSLEKLLELKRQIDAELPRAKAVENRQKRKADTRQKIVVGALILSHARNNPAFKDYLSKFLSRSPLKPAERELVSEFLSPPFEGTGQTSQAEAAQPASNEGQQ